MRHCEQSNRGSRAANPDISPISNNAVKILLSDQDRTHIIREMYRIEKRTVIAHVMGIRPRRADLRLLLQVALNQDVDNITDVHMLGQNYYQVEFELERMVPILLEKKIVAVSINGFTTYPQIRFSQFRFISYMCGNVSQFT